MYLDESGQNSHWINGRNERGKHKARQKFEVNASIERREIEAPQCQAYSYRVEECIYNGE